MNNEFPFEFWKCREGLYPFPARTARLVFTIVACSTGSERIFSVAGIVQNKHRVRLFGQMNGVIAKVGLQLKKI